MTPLTFRINRLTHTFLSGLMSGTGCTGLHLEEEEEEELE